MKRLFLILSVTLTLCTFTQESIANVVTGYQISLRRHPPISGATKPSKAPGYMYAEIELTYDEYNNELHFYDENEDVVFFSIYNNDGDCICQDTCDFDDEHSFSVSLNQNAGQYTIIVQINGVDYFGAFYVE